MSRYIFRNQSEENAYNVLTESGIQDFYALPGNDWLKDEMFNQWITAGIVKKITVDPGKPAKSVRLMSAVEKAAWDTHLQECFNATRYEATK